MPIKKKVTRYLHEHKHHITIHKLRTNQPITKAELSELERMLFDQGEVGTKEQFIKAYGEQPVGQFIRSMVGMDQSAAQTAFSKFINNPSLNAPQIRFLNLIVQSLSTNGVLDAEKLFEPPFTDISSNGLLGVFSQQQADELVNVIKSVNATATAV